MEDHQLPRSEEVLVEAEKDILKLLNSIPKEIQNEPHIKIYRAITGKQRKIHGEWIFEGADPDRMEKYGVFETNLSFAQFSEFTESGTHDKFVPGLPVFTDPKSAVGWLIRKKFSSSPVVVVLDIPISFLAGENPIIKLFLNNSRLATIEELKELSTDKPISNGECYMTSSDPKKGNVPEIIRDFEIFIQPKSISTNGRIDFSQGFKVTKTPKQPN